MPMYAKDAGLSVLCFGHHATETLGVKEVGKLLEKKFSVKTVFLANPEAL